MISSVAWVPRGAARADPKRAEPSAEELAALEDELQGAGEAIDSDHEDVDSGSGNEDSEVEEAGSMSEGGSDGEESARARAAAVAAAVANQRKGGGGGGGGVSRARGGGTAGATNDLEDALRELDMDAYDDEDGGDGARPSSVLQRALNGRLDLHRGGDPYLATGASDEDDDGSDADDLRIRPTDLVLLAARNEDDVSNLEVWIYEEAEELGGEANTYVHHEVLLPSFPLALAWMNCDPRAGAGHLGNLVAVASMEPGIEIWDLDTLDAVEPIAVLGGEDHAATAAATSTAEDVKLTKNQKKKMKTKAKKKGPTLKPGSHAGAVLGLSWNHAFRNVLASAGEDHVVKVWDVVAGQPAHDLTHHSSKVQAVAWNPAEAQVLLTGSFDRTAALVDVRAATAAPAVWKLAADVEALAWCPHQPTQFLVSCEDGVVQAHDARKGAAGGAGLLATGSTDKTAKLWDVSSGKPSLLETQDLQVGAVFTMGFSADAPHLLAVGGAAGSVSVWDVRASSAVAQKFPSLLSAAQQSQQA